MWPVNSSNRTPAQQPEQYSHISQQNPAKLYIYHRSINNSNRENKLLVP